MNNIDRAAKAINEQKGQITALTCIVMSLLRALPHDHLAAALQEFDIESETARVVLLNSGVPEDVLASFEQHVQIFNNLRTDRA